MSIRDEILRHEHEGWEVEPEYMQGFNCGLDCAADVAVAYVSKLTDERAHFERLVTYLRVYLKNTTLDEILDRGTSDGIRMARAALPALGAELDAAWDALTDDEKREMDALVHWEPS